MSGTWERGADPADAAAELETAAARAEESAKRNPRERGQENSFRWGRGQENNSRGGGATGREALSRRGSGEARSDRVVGRNGSGGIRGGSGGTRDERELSRNGYSATGSGRAGGGMRGAGSGRVAGGGGGDRREYFSRANDRNGSGSGGVRGGDGRGGGGGGEPDAKRPRVTSTIVIAQDNIASLANGELDRWNSASGNTEGEPEVTAADAGGEMEADTEEAATGAGRGGGGGADAPEDESGEANDGGGGEEEEAESGGPRFVSQIVVVPGGAKGRAARGNDSERASGEHRFLERAGGRAGRGRGGGGEGRRGAIRGSLASRLGPPMGRPVLVVTEGEGGGEFVAPPPRPMAVPSKPELHAAYKDGDTKKRNRR